MWSLGLGWLHYALEENWGGKVSPLVLASLTSWSAQTVSLPGPELPPEYRWTCATGDSCSIGKLRLFYRLCLQPVLGVPITVAFLFSYAPLFHFRPLRYPTSDIQEVMCLLSKKCFLLKPASPACSVTEINSVLGGLSASLPFYLALEVCTCKNRVCFRKQSFLLLFPTHITIP